MRIDATKLRKVSDDLYVKKKEGQDTKEVEYKREFEKVRFELFDARLVFWAGIHLKELQPYMESQDVNSSATAIEARGGEFEDGDTITVLDNDKPLTIDHVETVRIDRMTSWSEAVERFRTRGSQLWMGHASIGTAGDAWVHRGKADKLHLSLYMPSEQFDYIVNAIASIDPDDLGLSAIVSIPAFRADADRALSEPFHQKEIGIERSSPAILSSLTATIKKTKSDPEFAGKVREESMRREPAEPLGSGPIKVLARA